MFGLSHASAERVKGLAAGSTHLGWPRASCCSAALFLAVWLNSPHVASAEAEGRRPQFRQGTLTSSLPAPTGGEFTLQAEVTFQPGNERLTIRQEFKGIDEHDHLVMSTTMDGRIPEVPHGSTVTIEPYSEIYQYSNNRKLLLNVYH